MRGSKLVNYDLCASEPTNVTKRPAVMISTVFYKEWIKIHEFENIFHSFNSCCDSVVDIPESLWSFEPQTMQQKIV